MRKKTLCLIVLAALLVVAAVPAFAEDPPKDPWSYKLGLSYLGTSGNTDTNTFGTDFSFKRIPEPWGIEGGINYYRAEDSGDKTAERLRAAIKGNRAFGTRWEWFMGASWEQDKFAGIQDRTILATGATYKALLGPKNELAFDMALSWTDERYTDLVLRDNDDFFGGLLGMRYAHNWTKTSSLLFRAVYYPNFDDSSNWRGESELAVTAAMTDHLALKAGILWRYSHLPPPGFEETDTTTAVSLVFSF